VRHRTFTWLALGVALVAGNTALVLWLEGRPRPIRGGPGGGIASRPVREVPATARPLTEAEIAHPPGDEVRVRVVTTPGAAVRVLPDRRAAGSPFGGAPLAEGTAGPDGSLLVVLERRVRARVVASMEGRAPGEAPFLGPEVRLPLDPEGVVRGRVVEEGSWAPVAGATVVARHDPAPAVGGTSGADGTFVLRGLRAGRWTVRASCDRNPPATETVVVYAGGETAVELRLGKGFTLRGRVLFAGTDRTADEGTVAAEGRTALLGPGGRFVMSGLAGPARTFRVETGGAVYRAGGQTVRLDPATGEQVGEIEVPLPGNNPSGLLYSGIVKDESGGPVEGARVLVGPALLHRLSLIERGSGGEWHGEGLTDAGGRYRVSSGHGGREILVTHPDFAPTFFVLPPRSRNRAFDLVLAKGARVLVRVLDAAGRPAEGAEVYTCLRHPDPPLASIQYGDVQEGLGAHPLTDAAGTAMLARVGEGSWYLCARTADGLEGARVVLDRGSGAGDLAVDLRLRRLPSIAGRVVDRKGRPLAGVGVSAALDTALGDYRHVATGPDGRFRMEGLLVSPELEAAGALAVDVAGRGIGPRPVPIPLDGEREIVVERE
jgi:hypothetical protein